MEHSQTEAITMFCPNCGAQVPTNEKRCPSCGAQIPNSGDTESTTGSQATYTPPSPDQQLATRPAGKPISTTETWNPFAAPDAGVMAYAKERGIGMKWYLFILWLDLTVGIALGIWSSLQSITGLNYGDSASLVYSVYPLLQVIDVMYGAFGFALAVGRLYVRKRMAAFKHDGPKLLFVLYSAALGGTVIYSANVAFILSLSSIMSSGAFTAILVLVEIIINKVYFDKRTELFVY